MTTFNNGESLSSVRTKINEAIDKVDGNSAFDNDIDVNGNVSLGDNDELRLGTGQSAAIEHTGTLADIRNGVGHMYIRTFANDHDILIQSDNGSGGTANYFVADGSSGQAILYYYGAQKLNTASSGVVVDGNVSLGDNDELRLGDSNDLILEHNSTFGDILNKTGILALRNAADDQDVVIQTDNGSGGVADYFRADGSSGEAKLYYYGAEKLNTNSTGVDITGNLTTNDEIIAKVVLYGPSQDAPYMIAATTSYTGAATNSGTYGMQHRFKYSSGGSPRITVDGSIGGVATELWALYGSSGNMDVYGDLDVGGSITCKNNEPFIFLHEEDGPSANAQTSFTVNNGHFAMQTRNSSAGFVANDYYSNKNGSGAVDHSWRVAGNEKLKVDSTGVGIGQPNPGAELHIKASTPQFRLQPTADTQNNRIEFCNAAGSIQSRIMSGGSNGDLIQLDGNVQVQAGHNLLMPDNVELRFGDSNDLKIDHNGTNSFIANSTGDLYINQSADDKDVVIRTDDGSGSVADYFRADGSTGQTKLYHLGSQKLTTQSWGVGVTGDLNASGALSKGSGSFKIDHPLKPETHHLVHSFVEAPQADNIYRGKVSLVGGSATVNLDEAGRMTEGTFVALNGNIQCFTTNEDGWTPVRGSVFGNILTIQAQDASCIDIVSWLVIGERHDQHMIDTGWTDAAGRVITEPEKQTEEEE